MWEAYLRVVTFDAITGDEYEYFYSVVAPTKEGTQELCTEYIRNVVSIGREIIVLTVSYVNRMN